MLAYSNNKHVGIVLQVHEDYVKMINEVGGIVNIKNADINKKFERDKKTAGLDQLSQTIAIDTVVKIVEGRNKVY
jgi:hypothetical protein